MIFRANAGQAQVWTSLLQLNTFGLPSSNIVASDADNVYMAFTFSGPITFSGLDYTSVGGNDLLIAKISNAGAVIWVKQINAQPGGAIIGTAIKIDLVGNIFVAGNYSGTLKIGNNTIVSSSTNNAFLAKFNTEGVGLWATPFTYSGTGSSKMVFDMNGNTYLLSASSKLLKFNSLGTELWEQSYFDRTLQAIAIDNSNLYIGGALQTTTRFGTLTLQTTFGYNTGFIVKADLNGVYQNSVIAGNSVYTNGMTGTCVSDIVIDNSGKLIIAGGYEGNIKLGTFSSTNTSNILYTYIAKCNSDFVFEWVNSSSALNDFYRNIWTYRIFLDNSNNIYESGMNTGIITFGSVQINNPASNQFLLKFDPDGKALNSYSIPNSSFDKTIVTTSGNVMVCGTYNLDGITTYGNIHLSRYNNNLTLAWKKVSSNAQGGIAKINYIRHDPTGNTFIQSRVIGHCNYFGTIINTNTNVTVISKHDITGNLLWMKQIRDISPYLFGSAFTLDKDNNVLTVGLFKTYLDIGTTTLTSTNYSYEGYVAKYSSNGDFQWAAPLNIGTGVSTSINVATDRDGNVLVTGVKAPDNYLVKYSASGTQLWAKSMPMQSWYWSMVSTDANNNIYLASEIHMADNGTGSVMIGSVNLSQSISDGSTVLIKFDPNGNALWAKTYGSVSGASYNDGWPCAIKTDDAGNSYLWGWVPDNAMFGTTLLTNPFTPNSSYSKFLTKINTNGDVVWVNPVYEKYYGNNYGDLLDIDKNGNIYVGGHFRDKVNIIGEEYSPEGKYDFYLLKYSNSGLFQWIKTIPSNTTFINSLSVINENSLSVAGAAGMNPTLGDFTINKKGGSNCMVATLSTINTGAPEIENSEILIFPNPAHSTLFFAGLKQNPIITISDLNGRILLNKMIASNQIDISTLVNGIYTVQIIGKDGIITKKLVKK